MKGRTPSVSPVASVSAQVQVFESHPIVQVAARPAIVTVGSLINFVPTIVSVATSPTFARVVVLLLLTIVTVVSVPALVSRAAEYVRVSLSDHLKFSTLEGHPFAQIG